ncbi:MAG TPA: hypothetical protein VEX86_09840 [Longimicrobium sp.]|nr:hypothetical protein [Longimicrobium sp.]
MSAWTWIAGALGAGALWLLWEFIGALVAEVLAGVLGGIFSPVHRRLVRLLAGPSGGAWLAGLTAVFVALAVAGGTLVAMLAPAPWLALGACATIAGLAALLVLDSARNEVKLARANPCASLGVRAR